MKSNIRDIEDCSPFNKDMAVGRVQGGRYKFGDPSDVQK